MKLNHINLAVSDVQNNRRFLEKYLGMKSMEGTKDDDTHVAMLDDDGFMLGLMKSNQNTEIIYPSSFHIGFIKESEERVNEIYLMLKEDGFDVKPPGYYRRGMDLYFHAPGGFAIQVSY